MKIVITDSGLGGLSVCGYFEKKLHNLADLSSEHSSKVSSSQSQALEIIYVNAVPADDRGYNSMSDKNEKISVFSKVLKNIESVFSPDLIFVACGSLSVLLPEIYAVDHFRTPIQGIVETGIENLSQKWFQDRTASVLIFATPTTIEEKTFQNELSQLGVNESKMIAQACPELATQISNDIYGQLVEQKIRHWVEKATDRLPKPFHSKIIAFLGCTHFGYRQQFFQKALNELGFMNFEIVNPNQQAADHIMEWLNESNSESSKPLWDHSILFISPYSIPQQEQITLPKLLAPISTETAEAFNSPCIMPDLIDT